MPISFVLKLRKTDSDIGQLSGLQGYVNKIDFDYLEYARQRFQQYWLRKPELLGSPGISP